MAWFRRHRPCSSGRDPNRTRRSVSAGGLWIKSARRLKNGAFWLDVCPRRRNRSGSTVAGGWKWRRRSECAAQSRGGHNNGGDAMSTHPSDCFCPLCVQQVRGQADAAQAQTLGVFDDLSRLRRRLRSLRAFVVAETERMHRIIDSHIGPSGAVGGPQMLLSRTGERSHSLRKPRWKPRRGRKERRR